MQTPVRLMLLATAITAGVLTGCSERDPIKAVPEELPENEAPVIDSLRVERVVLGTSEATRLAVFARDPEGSPLAFDWTASAGSLDPNEAEATWTAPIAEGTFEVEVTVFDGDGASDRKTAHLDVMDGTLLVDTRDGLLAVRMDGTSSLLHERHTKVEVLGTRIFLMDVHGMTEIDLQGKEIATIELSDVGFFAQQFAIHPDGGFSFHNNVVDSSYVAGPDGRIRARIAMPNPSPNSLQVLDGIVAGDRLIMAETGNRDLFEIDLTTFESEVVRSLPGNYLSSFARHTDGTYYVTRAQQIERFVGDGEAEIVATTEGANIVGIVPVLRSLFIVQNFSGTLLRIDRFTGEETVILDGLNFPEDLEYLPVPIAPVP